VGCKGEKKDIARAQFHQLKREENSKFAKLDGRRPFGTVSLTAKERGNTEDNRVWGGTGLGPLAKGDRRLVLLQ